VLTPQTDLNDAKLVLLGTRLQRLTNLIDLYRALSDGLLELTGDEARTGVLNS
jgi:outer membrane protein TolC